MRDAASRRRVRVAGLSQRLIDVIDGKLKAYERRLAADSERPPSADDAERDSRMLQTLVRLFEKLTTPGERAAARKAAPLNKRTMRGADDAARIRDAIAQRLGSLRPGDSR
jgi:cell division septation protein DedD